MMKYIRGDTKNLSRYRVRAMIKILFVCHGNICRSPMAEAIFNHMAKEKGLEEEFSAASAAVSREEIGNPIYPPAQRKLRREGIPFAKRGAVQIAPGDYELYDFIIGMEEYNLRGMLRILGGDPKGKVSRLLDFTSHPRDVDDPWYTGDFDLSLIHICAGYGGVSLSECAAQ